MPEPAAPHTVTPPGTCSLDLLRGEVLLGGVAGTWTVEIAREREWAAFVWQPDADTSDPDAAIVVKPFLPVYEETSDLIQTMIGQVQEAHREGRPTGRGGVIR